jgi:hypothetical protein
VHANVKDLSVILCLPSSAAAAVACLYLSINQSHPYLPAPAIKAQFLLN